MLNEQSIYAGDTYTYTANLALANNLTWSANAVLTNLDYADLIVANVAVGVLSANLVAISSPTPNSTNYTLNLGANSATTALWIANSVDPNERTLYLNIKYTANNGTVIHGNTQILRVKAAIDI